MNKVQAALSSKIRSAVVADPTLAQDKEKLGKKAVELYADAINESALSATPRKITMNLKASSKKSCWQISNAKTSVAEIIKAFYLGM